MRSGRSLAPLFLAAFLPGCATIVHGTQQDVSVVSDPPGAIASAGSQRILTPGILSLPRKAREIEVKGEKEGYVTRRVRLSRETSHKAVWLDVGAPLGGIWIGGEVGNRAAPDRSVGCSSSGGAGICTRTSNLSEIVVGAAVGAAVLGGLAFGVDYANGAAYRLEPPQISVTLEPMRPASPPAGGP